LGKNQSGRKLKHVNLSGCVNITDVTLQRISTALGAIPGPENTRTRDCEVVNTCNIRGRMCCCHREADRSPQEQGESRLEFDSVDSALRNACDFVEREVITQHLIDILEGESMLSPFTQSSFVPSLFMKWTDKNSASVDRRLTYLTEGERTWSSSMGRNPELFPLYYVNSNRTTISLGNSPLRTGPSLERSDGDIPRRTNSSTERLSGSFLPWTTASSGCDSGCDGVCDNGDSDTPTRGLRFLSLSGCSLLTDEGLRY
jgi:hypothetical protein